MNDVTIICVGLHPFGRFDGKADGATEITGAMPVNTNGGLIANGEPIGAAANPRDVAHRCAIATRPKMLGDG